MTGSDEDEGDGECDGDAVGGGLAAVTSLPAPGAGSRTVDRRRIVSDCSTEGGATSARRGSLIGRRTRRRV